MNTLGAWILATNVIAGGWGSVWYSYVEFPTQHMCYEALNKAKVTDNGKLAQGDRGQNVIMRCYPKPAEK